MNEKQMETKKGRRNDRQKIRKRRIGINEVGMSHERAYTYYNVAVP